jgi:hypothetical protein
MIRKSPSESSHLHAGQAEELVEIEMDGHGQSRWS